MRRESKEGIPSDGGKAGLARDIMRTGPRREETMDITQILETKKEDILQIAAKHGARNVRVFGSVARGEARPESDVDLLVEVGPDRTPFFPGGLIADLEDLLGKKVQVVTREDLHWYIRDRVLEEAVPL